MLPVPKAKIHSQESKLFSCKILITNGQNLQGDSKLKIAKIDQKQEDQAQTTRNNQQRAIEISS